MNLHTYYTSKTEFPELINYACGIINNKKKTFTAIGL